ncbi:heavy metal translocating P-type ATPase [Polaromonas sp. LjRoot131]|uniref:heavy metal translocating P-type ATPase n=1 Tax=Polaromonas sp. LjRoot131 TaxID=3342262 RepID=UPI003ECFB2D6
MQATPFLLPAGPVQPAVRDAAAWIAMDEPAEWEGFSRPVPGREGWWESCLALEGMHCAACALTVEEALRRLPGVDTVEVNGVTATARLQWQPQATRPSLWMAALRQAGYGALPAGDLLLAGNRLRAQRLMLWRWLVAGFCMMQVMMYAAPAYLSAPGEITPDIQALLGWASWVLTLPVLLFSCWPFFAAALRDLRNARIGMDVPVALGVLIAFSASTAATFDPASPWGLHASYDSVPMFVFFLLSGRLLEQRLRDRTAGALEALMRRLPDSAERQEADGSFRAVAVRRLMPGDLVRVLPGQAFPADGDVEGGESRVDQSLLTGESKPLLRRVGDGVIAGSHNLTSVLLVRVQRVGPQTRYAEIVALMEQASVEKPGLVQLVDRIASPFLVAVLLAAAGAAWWWWPFGQAHAMAVAVSVLIVTCPCALSLATPAAMLASAGALARRGLLVRRLQALEGCAAVDTVIFDKTGTLTEDRMDVVMAHVPAGVNREEVCGMAGALASHSLHPVSRAIAAHFPVEASASGWVASEVEEVTGRGLRGKVAKPDGSGARYLYLGSASFCRAPAGREGPVLQAHLSDGEHYLAGFELDEAIRPDTAQAVAALLKLGIRVQLLSGDTGQAVARLARRAGIEWCFSECTPEAKLEHLRGLQREGHRVMMVGDGMNDGPVLAAADVSMAMGQAVPLAQAKADFIMAGNRLLTVAALVEQARRTRSVVRQNLLWAAIYNAACVPLAIMGYMPTWLAGFGMAASSLLVVANSARLARAVPEN